MKRTLILLALLSGAAQTAYAASDPVLGLWQTTDEKTNAPSALVKLEVVDDVLRGTIVKIFPQPGVPADPVCKLCPDERRDKPVLGMTILSGLKRTASGQWSGGEILDPKVGKIYKVKLSATENSKTMDVHGYIGAAWLGKTRIWHRE
jgi:uncharacterized protein (DUF2147 family)